MSNQPNRPNPRDRQTMPKVTTGASKTATRLSSAVRPTVQSSSVSEPVRREGVASRKRRESDARNATNTKILIFSVTVLVLGLAVAYYAACLYIGADPAHLGDSLGLLFKTLAGK